MRLIVNIFKIESEDFLNFDKLHKAFAASLVFHLRKIAFCTSIKHKELTIKQIYCII